MENVPPTKTEILINALLQAGNRMSIQEATDLIYPPETRISGIDYPERLTSLVNNINYSPIAKKYDQYISMKSGVLQAEPGARQSRLRRHGGVERVPPKEPKVRSEGVNELIPARLRALERAITMMASNNPAQTAKFIAYLDNCLIQILSI